MANGYDNSWALTSDDAFVQDPNFFQQMPQFTTYQHSESSPSYAELSSPFPMENSVPMPSYLPNTVHMLQESMASNLPDLGEGVAEVLEHSNINNSIEKLSLLTSPPPPISDLAYMNNGMGGSMSSSSNGGGSLTNGFLANGNMVQNNMQCDEVAPHSIEILEQPMEFGYRFRYEVEGKAHGGLQGQSSKNGGPKRGNKVYPEIQVCNVPCDVDEVEIEARLVSATEDFYPHPNKCSGKDCNPNGIFRKTLKRTEQPEFKLTFNNLTILQIKKGDQKKSLRDQLKDIADNIRVSTPVMPQSEVELDNKSDGLCKQKHNGVVRIRFQASYYSQTLQRWQVVSTHSKSIHDQKQTNAAELRICRVSSNSAPVTGGTSEIYLLCEKVLKDDIKVKFKHDNWEADGIFNGTDVHYQYAIVFRAPQYKNLDIQRDVKVQMMLFRPSTGTYSKPLDFTYHPNRTDEEEVARKRKRPANPNDMTGYYPYQSPYGPYGNPPSDGRGGSDNYYGGYSGSNPNFPGGTQNYSKSTASPTASSKMDSSTQDSPVDLTKPKVGKDNDNIPSTIGTVDEVESDIIEDVEADDCSSSAKHIKVENVDSVARAPIKVEPGIVKAEPQSNKSEHKADEDDDDLETDCAQHIPIGLKISQQNIAFAKQDPRRFGNTKTMHKTETHKVESTGELASLKKELEKEKAKRKHLEKHVAACEDLVIESLMNFAITGDHLYFVSQFRYFLKVKDEHGDSCIHMAVINGQLKALNDMLSICSATNTAVAVNQLNDKHQTPLHIATIIKNTQMVEALLKHNGDALIKDQNGNNCFHIASRNEDFKTLELLCQWLKVTGQEGTHLDELNYEGYTPLHKAVLKDSVECIRELIHGGACVNKVDGTSGRTALHHAVQKRNIITTAELVLQAKADVNAQAFDGNTPLHLAISLTDEHIARMLVKSGADLHKRNRDYETVDSDEGEDVDEERTGLNVYEMCKDNEQMLEVIQKALLKETKQTGSHEFMGSIRSLPDKTMDRLSELLDQDSHDWKRLAKLFELNSVINYMETKSNTPTRTLLTYLANNDRTVKDLTDALRKISRQDCVAVIERFGSKPTNVRYGSFQDSGFVDFTSGNL